MKLPVLLFLHRRLGEEKVLYYFCFQNYTCQAMDITENQIYCMMPFYFDEPMSVDPGGVWMPVEARLDKDAMYTFMYTGTRMNRIYGIDTDSNLRKFFQQTSEVGEIDGDSGRRISCNLMNNPNTPWRAPRLVISHGGDVGMLVIPLSMSGTNSDGSPLTGDQVCDFVNRLQKYDSGQTPVFTYRVKGGVHILQDKLDEALGLCFDGRPNTWTIGALTDLLLKPISDRITMFKPFRCHILTYLLSEGSPAGPYVLSDEDRRMFMRIVHCQNRRYHVMLGDCFDRCVMHPFENIYEGISVEGSCVMGVLQHSSGDKFLESHGTGTFQSRFMWMYINAVMQRHALLDVDRRIADAAGNLDGSGCDSDMQFSQSLRRICAMRLTGVFTSISAYSHINERYVFLLRNLGVKDLYDELDEKLRTIDSWLKLVEARQNAESIRLQEEAAAKRAKFERFVQTGGVILAVLALLYGIPQAVTAMHDTVRNGLWLWSVICLVPAITGLIWLIIAMNNSRN